MDLHQQPMRPLHSKSDPHSSQFFVFVNGNACDDRLLHKKSTRRIVDPEAYFLGPFFVERCRDFGLELEKLADSE